MCLMMSMSSTIMSTTPRGSFSRKMSLRWLHNRSTIPPIRKIVEHLFWKYTPKKSYRSSYNTVRCLDKIATKFSKKWYPISCTTCNIYKRIRHTASIGMINTARNSSNNIHRSSRCITDDT